jgi:hypothetical protein
LRLVLELGERREQSCRSAGVVWPKPTLMSHRQAAWRALLRLIQGGRKQHCRKVGMAYIQTVLTPIAH